MALPVLFFTRASEFFSKYYRSRIDSNIRLW